MPNVSAFVTQSFQIDSSVIAVAVQVVVENVSGIFGLRVTIAFGLDDAQMLTTIRGSVMQILADQANITIDPADPIQIFGLPVMTTG